MIALDCETTGLDLYHGAKPFLVTTCDENGDQQWWEWDVDPLTRQPIVCEEDLEEIQATINDADSLVLQNPKFDVAALQTVFSGDLQWDWSKVFDTLLAGHLLASNQPHDLTTMALIYLGINVKPFDDAMKKCVEECRRTCRGKNAKYPDWRIAKKELPEMPSAKEKVWKFDSWLPLAIANEEGLAKDHTYRTVTADYANSDSETTLALFLKQREILEERGLWCIYLERLKVLPVVYKIEARGVTLNRKRLKELVTDYKKESARAGRLCTNIAKSMGHELILPKSGNNNSLLGFVFGEDGLNLPVVKKSKKTGKPSFDKDCIEEYQATLPKRSKALTFVDALRGKRSRDTALNYLEGYKKFWLPVVIASPSAAGLANYTKSLEWYRLHPSLNPTGTLTLRWSSSNPNEQNISKKEGFNLRYCFGPAPGREWWSIDAKNIELRIPAYEAGETEQIELFENPNVAPYFGSNHLLVFDTLHTKRLGLDTSNPKYLLEAKKKYASTWYQWTKNGNFAVQYGAMEKSGTADRAYHLDGGQRRIQGRFKKVKELNELMIAFAEEHGYVETMPDKTVDPERGYPLFCSRTSYGRISPTIPLNYHVQGTACWWMCKAMVRCQEYLDERNSSRKEAHHAYMVMQVHDEIVFDFPKSNVDPTKKQEGFNRLRCNLPAIKAITKMMEQGGDDIGVPTPVSVEYHSQTWSEGVAV